MPSRHRSHDMVDWLSVREYGGLGEQEFTVVKVDAYNDINSYLSELSCTEIKTLEDVVSYNDSNPHTEGAHAGDHPAFTSGQVSSPPALVYALTKGF